MKGSALRESILIIILLLFDASKGDPRSQIINMTCSQQLADNVSIYTENFVQSLNNTGSLIRTSKSGMASTGSGPDSSYGLAECYGDISIKDCTLCHAKAETSLLNCFPRNGGRIFLDGCFMRTQNYSFFKEYAGTDDTVICGNTKRSRVFRDSVRQAISDIVRDAPRNKDYFARKQELSDTEDDSVYVLADCWNTLDENSCTECLENAFAAIMKCFPQRRAMMEPSVFIHLTINPPLLVYGTGMNDKYLVIQPACGNIRATNLSFIPSFVQTMVIVSTGIIKSSYGTAVVGTETNLAYGLGQCYGDISTSDCLVCYAIARTAIPSCLPSTSGRVYLNSCFLRYENYNFFEEYTGLDDRSICPNDTRKNNAFEQSVRKAVAQAVETAPKSNNYHARIQILISGTENELVYAQAECLRTLDAGSCEKCLQKAAKSMLDCLPGSEGYALYTGCFMRYSDSNSSNPHHSGLSKVKILAIVMAVSSIVAFSVAFFACSDGIKLLKMLNSSSLNFKYSTIKKATNSFDEANKLGQGGFGTVYKGVLPNGREIAVKRLFFNQIHRAGDFYNEVNIISSVDHKNLVKLVGFSCLGPESILVYEYLPNRSLNHFIFDAVRGKELNWGKRYDIIIVTGMPNRGMQASGDPRNLISISWEHFKQGSMEEIFYENLMLKNESSSKTKEEIERVVHIGLLCIQEVVSLRPTMSMALQMLSKNIQPLPSPANPPYIPDTTIQLNELGPINSHRVNNTASLPTVSNSSFIPR
ncbi:hypothetical protein L1987_17169 [Smallanthus sonchifolius]|uniref:Uncharacterized protein n=1 Tax=Smallanthus sonchifolius TaxID=185202 RepID=A0ACB9IWR2_9ASTR|nr:hypothetical protein L1987_17169 [Smallanthus sonchifolius]